MVYICAKYRDIHSIYIDRYYHNLFRKCKRSMVSNYLFLMPEGLRGIERD